MTDTEPEKGDKVAWNWGGGAPGGVVAEKKTEGEIAIESKRGNIIKRNAEPDNPAIHVSRSGNDVVKKASELVVDEKANNGDEDGDAKEQTKSEHNGEEAKNKSCDHSDEAKEYNASREASEKEQSHGEKRKAENQNGAAAEEGSDAEENKHTQNSEGKEVKSGGKEANKRRKQEQEEGKSDDGADNSVSDDNENSQGLGSEEDDTEKTNQDDRGKPKEKYSSGNSKQAQDGAGNWASGDTVSSRTRSRDK